MKETILRLVAVVILLAVAVGSVLLDNRLHQNCKRIDGYVGGKYTYLWECPR